MERGLSVQRGMVDDVAEPAVVDGSDVIELGENRWAPVGGSRRSRPPLRRSQLRGGAVVAVIAAVFAVLGGAAAMAQPRLGSPLWTQQIAFQPKLTPSAIFARPLGSAHVSALDRGTGKELWHLDDELDQPVQILQAYRGAPVAIESIPAGDQPDPQNLIEIREAVHGGVITRLRGGLEGYTGSGDQFVVRQFGSADCGFGGAPQGEDDGSGQCDKVVTIDGRTGKVGWQLSIQPFTQVEFVREIGAPKITYVGVVAPYTGEYALYSPSKGDRVTHGFLPMTAVQNATPLLLADREIAIYPDADAVGLIAASFPAGTPDGLHDEVPEPDWTTPLRLQQFPTVYDCGSYICLDGEGDLLVLDKKSGAQRVRTQGTLVEVTAAELVILTVGGGNGKQEALRFFDRTRGSVRVALQIQSLVGRGPGGDLVALRSDRTGQTVLFIDQYAQSTSLGRLTAASPELANSDCDTDGEALACVDTASTLRVWRLYLH